VREIALKYGLGAAELCNEWVAFSKQHDDCDMNAESVERWENQLYTNNRKTPSSKKTVSRTGYKPPGPAMYMADDLNGMFGETVEEENLMDEYATPQDKEKMVTFHLM